MLTMIKMPISFNAPMNSISAMWRMWFCSVSTRCAFIRQSFTSYPKITLFIMARHLRSRIALRALFQSRRWFLRVPTITALGLLKSHSKRAEASENRSFWQFVLSLWWQILLPYIFDKVPFFYVWRKSKTHDKIENP